MRKNIAHRNLVPGRLVKHLIPNDPAVKRGRKWFELAACRRCHTVNGTGNRLAGNLDKLKGRHPQQLFDSIRKPVAFMPDFRFDEEAAGDLVNAIMGSRYRHNGDSRESPLLVRFSGGIKRTENAFVKRCGGCHRILTKGSGPLGAGEAGPNLSGLLTKFFPRTYGNGRYWTAERLDKWLANPRQSRPNARMQPVRYKSGEFGGLIKIINDI